MRVRNIGLFSALLLAWTLMVACSRTRTDAQLASEAQNKINGDARLADKSISVAAENGVVTLFGKVPSDMERTIAGNDAAQIEGVKSVVNNLEVAPSVSGALPAAPAQVARAHHPKTMTPSPRPGRTYVESHIVVPEGTAIPVRLIDPINSDRNKAGDSFQASVASPVMVGDQLAIPKDADVEGKIVDLKSAGHFTGRSDLGLVLTAVSVNGRTYQLDTDEFVRQGASRGKRTAETVGGGAGVGALIGGLTGGGKGAAIGAGIGAGAGTGLEAVTKGQQIRLPSETILEFRLKAPLTMQPSAMMAAR